MANRFLDSVGHYNTAQIFRKWTAGAGSIGVVAAPAGGSGGNCIQIAGTQLRLTLDAQTTWIYGARVIVTAAGNDIFSVMDVLSTQVRLYWLGDNRVQARLGLTGAVIGTSPLAYPILNWNYIEMKVFVNGATGTCEVRINGAVVILATGLNTAQTGNAFANVFGITGNGGGENSKYQDIYVNDGTGAVANDFFGDVKIYCVLPNSDGPTLNWVPSAGVTHFNLVNENPADDDTSYVSSNVVGDIDLYGFPVLAFNGVIQAVQICLLARKDDAGARSLSSAIRIGGVNYIAAAQFISETYLYYRTVYNVSPATGVLFTLAEINAAKYGMKEVS